MVVFVYFCISASSQDLNRQLITIHNVDDAASMNAIANPDQQSLVYVSSEKLTYQYIDTEWIPFSSTSYSDSLYVDSLINALNVAFIQRDSCCAINTSTPDIPKVGDIIGCGVVFHITHDWSEALIVSLEEFTGPWGCLGQNVPGANDINYGLVNTNDIVSAGCLQEGDAAQICVNYDYGGCTDWYLPSYLEWRILIHAYGPVNQTLNSLSAPELVEDWLYWTSGDQNGTNAYDFNWAIYGLGVIFQTNLSNKTDILRVRPIRKHIF